MGWFGLPCREHLHLGQQKYILAYHTIDCTSMNAHSTQRYMDILVHYNYLPLTQKKSAKVDILVFTHLYTRIWRLFGYECACAISPLPVSRISRVEKLWREKEKLLNIFFTDFLDRLNYISYKYITQVNALTQCIFSRCINQNMPRPLSQEYLLNCFCRKSCLDL